MICLNCTEPCSRVKTLGICREDTLLCQLGRKISLTLGQYLSGLIVSLANGPPI